MKKTFIIGLSIFQIAASLPWSRILDGGEAIDIVNGDDIDIGNGDDIDIVNGDDIDIVNGDDIEIVNGDDIDISKVPYQVGLIVNGQFGCGGSIINENFILTAAHCVEKKWLNYRIRAGSSNWKTGGVLVKVADVKIHPKYINQGYWDYDIAVLKLQKPLKFSNLIAPAKLADKSYEVKDGDNVLVTGWGKTKPGNGHPAAKLQGVELPKMNFEQCKQAMRKILGLKLTNNYICAMHPNDGHNACQGDSGGPLAHKGTQVGVVSYGGPCNRRKAPVAYTSVAVLRDWIESIAGKL